MYPTVSPLGIGTITSCGFVSNQNPPVVLSNEYLYKILEFAAIFATNLLLVDEPVILLLNQTEFTGDSILTGIETVSFETP